MTEVMEKNLESEVSERKLSIVPFAAEDIMGVDVDETRHPFLMENKDNKEIFKQFETNGLSYTILDDHNNIISMFGILPQGEVGFSWTVNSIHFKKHALNVSRAIKRLLDKEGALFGKVLSAVEEGYEVGHRWAKFMGFENTGHGFKVGGLDYLLFERTF